MEIVTSHTNVNQTYVIIKNCNKIQIVKYANNLLLLIGYLKILDLSITESHNYRNLVYQIWYLLSTNLTDRQTLYTYALTV